jgi:hypothetical protein
MARAKKLFPIYGSALANNMLAALQREHIVAGFVAAYLEEYSRRGILGGPARDRELAETIGREVVITMTLEVRRVLPGFFGKRLRSKLKNEEKESIDLFLRELVGALGRAWNWDSEDRRQFRRDFSLYSDFAARKTSAASANRKHANVRVGPEESPFVGRVALLLDPSMLDQARRAARKFHGEIAPLAQKLLKQTLRPSRA